MLASGRGIYLIPRTALHAGPGPRIFPVRHPRQDTDSLGLRDGGAVPEASQLLQEQPIVPRHRPESKLIGSPVVWGGAPGGTTPL